MSGQINRQVVIASRRSVLDTLNEDRVLIVRLVQQAQLRAVAICRHE